VILSRNYRVEEAAILWYFALDIGNRLFSVFWLVHGRILRINKTEYIKVLSSSHCYSFRFLFAMSMNSYQILQVVQGFVVDLYVPRICTFHMVMS
jgi:hypothetical protein